MIIKHFRWFLFFSLIPLTLFADGGTFEHKVVAEINIEFQNLPQGVTPQTTAILNKMQTRMGNRFSQEEFDQDLKALSADYDRTEPVLNLMGDKLYLTLKVWIRPCIKQIVFCGNERVSTKKLLKKSELEVGGVLERDVFIEAINKIRYLYIKKGYFEASITYKVVPVDNCGEAIVTITIDEGRAGKIKKIAFSGLTKHEESALLEMMVTKKFNIFYGWLTGAGCYHPEMIEHDRIQIINYLQNQGYADANVEICLAEGPSANRITVCITVDKGYYYTVANMTLTGNSLFSKENIYEQFQVYINGPYSPDALRLTTSAIERLYGSCGYIDAYVEVELVLHESNPTYDIHFNVVEGEQYRVGLIKVFGNNTTNPSVILHESLLCPGEIFNAKKLEGTEQRIGNTGLFDCVNVYAVSSQEADECGPSFRDVYIEVEEADTGHLGLFFGFSSLNRLFGGAEISERNFNYRGLLNALQYGPSALRGGGEYVNLKANFGDRQRTYLFQWTKPYFLDTPWIVGFDLEKNDNRAVSRGYDIKTWGGHVTASYICNDYLKYSAHYRATQTHNSLRSGSSPLLEQEGKVSGFISAVGLTMLYDSTDHPRRPHHGFRSRLYGELGGLGGNFEFMKFGYLNSYYYPITRKGVLKFRFDVEFIHTYGRTAPTDLPLAERLYLGGETTVRGYRPYIIGPKFGPNEPRGGVSSLLASEEFQHPLFPGVDWFVFIDSGYVSLSEFTLGELSTSLGFGIRVDLVKSMPFCVGLGYPIHFNKAETQRFFFSMGGTF